MPRVLFWPVPRMGLELRRFLRVSSATFLRRRAMRMRIYDGTIRKGTKIRIMSSGRVFEVTRVGITAPGPVEVGEMKAGEVGFLMAGIKEVKETRIGDTITADERPCLLYTSDAADERSSVDLG